MTRLSVAQTLARLDDVTRDELLAHEDVEALARDWRFWARPDQLAPPGAWMIWLVMAGRGWGKTRVGSEWCIDRFQHGHSRGALVGRRVADTRDVMVEGASGIGACAEYRRVHCRYEPSKRRVTLREPGVGGARHTMRWTTYTAEEPDNLAGPEHDSVWGDEPAAWALIRDGAGRTAHDNLLLGLRYGSDVRATYTTTPRSTDFMRQLVNDPLVHVTPGALYDNVDNLAATFVDQIVGYYAGTRIGRQEIYGELLDDVGTFLRRTWFGIADERPPGDWHDVRYWDFAATEANDRNPDPDWTVGARVAFDRQHGVYWVDHIERLRATPRARNERLTAITIEDGLPLVIVEQEPGSSGKDVIESISEMLYGVARVEADRPTGAKVVRAQLLADHAEAGRVMLRAADWNTTFLDECEMFPDGAHDDQVDAVVGAMAKLNGVPRPAHVHSPVGISLPGR